MSDLQTSATAKDNKVIDQSLTAQEATLATETTETSNVVELADEDLEAVAGGSRGRSQMYVM